MILPTSNKNDYELTTLFIYSPLHGSLDICWPTLVDLNRRGAGIFVTINVTDGRGPKAENVIEVRSYFGDDVPVEHGKRLPLLPSVVVETSLNNVSVFYFVSDASLSDFTPTQEKLTSLFDSDPNVKDLPRVMRLPGFLHQKNPEAPFKTRIHWDVTKAPKGCASAAIFYSNAEFQNALTEALKQHPSSNSRNGSSVASKSRPEVPQSIASAAGNISPVPAWSEHEDAKLRSALDYKVANGQRVWDPDCDYETWIAVAAAVASLGWGAKAEDIFVWWSSQAMNDGLYPGEDACRKKVQSFTRARSDKSMTEASLYRKALDAGWEPPAQPSSQQVDAPPLAPGASPPVQQENNVPISPTRYVARDFSKISRRQWLYGQHYIRQYVTGTVAPGGMGKTAEAIAEAISMVVEKDLLNSNAPVKRSRVWYINGEDPRTSYCCRLFVLRN
jgi:hypothetical protein